MTRGELTVGIQEFGAGTREQLFGSRRRTAATATVVVLLTLVLAWGVAARGDAVEVPAGAPGHLTALADVVVDDRVLDDSLRAHVLSIASRENGWLHVVTDYTAADSGPAEICAALDSAAGTPAVPIMVVDREELLLQAC